MPFKIYLYTGRKYFNVYTNLIQNTDAFEVFKNNPYIIIDETYPNIIYFNIISNYYWKQNNYNSKTFYVYDNKHIVDFYTLELNLINSNKHGELYLSNTEIINVKKYLPQKKFIFVSYQGKVNTRSYSKTKFQNIINKIKNKFIDYDIIQIIPETYKNIRFDKLDNVITYKNNFNYRETIFFASHAKLCIVPHGGLSIGMACYKTPTICLYSSLFNPIMTTYDSEIVINFTKHNYCYDILCNICINNKNSHNESEIFEKIIKILQ
jgi:ADP-heptose:LPS heptosyltransferase